MILYNDSSDSSDSNDRNDSSDSSDSFVRTDRIYIIDSSDQNTFPKKNFFLTKKKLLKNIFHQNICSPLCYFPKTPFSYFLYQKNLFTKELFHKDTFFSKKKNVHKRKSTKLFFTIFITRTVVSLIKTYFFSLVFGCCFLNFS